jgi:GT2 family glycosyltransferase
MVCLISICIPAYNAERFLSATLATVRGQQFKDWELIVTEDGSNDRTADIVHKFSATIAQPVQYIRHSKNQGLPATRNTGIDAACAEWIALLDSDDLWEANHLSELVNIAKAGSAAELIHSGSILFDSETNCDLEVRAPTQEIVNGFPCSLFEGRYIIQPSSVILKKSLWKRVGGFNPAFRYLEDREMWLRCARAGAVFSYSGRVTCRYRKHTAALSNNAAEMAEASAAVFEQHLDWGIVPYALSSRWCAETWASAGKLRQKGDPLVAAAHFRSAYARRRRLEWRLRAIVFGFLGRMRRN